MIVGVCAPGGYYSSFIDHYFNYVKWLRATIMYTCEYALSLVGYKTYLQNPYLLKLQGGLGVHIVYSCLGIGVMSFWGAFVFANERTWIQKLKWIIGGWIIIWSINVTRIVLLILATNKGWVAPFNLDHHTLFNIAAYTAIFILIYFFDRSGRDKPITKQPGDIAY